MAAAGLGAVGGAIIEILYVWSSLTAWQQARRKARQKRRGKLPGLGDYLDPVADSLVAGTRLALGAAACLLFMDQITGPMAAIAVGASAPALLRQVGTLRSLRGVQAAETQPASHMASETASETGSQAGDRQEVTP